MLRSGAWKSKWPLGASQPPSDPAAGTAGRPKHAESHRGKRVLGEVPSLAAKHASTQQSLFSLDLLKATVDLRVVGQGLLSRELPPNS